MKTKNSRGLNAYSPFWAMKKKQQSHLIILAHGSPMGYHNPWPSSVITNHLLYINFPHGFGAEIPIKRAPWLRGPVVNRREATLCNSPSNTAGGTWRGNATFVSGNGLYITISTKSFFLVSYYTIIIIHILYLCKQIYHVFPWPPRRLFVRRLIVYHRKMLKSPGHAVDGSVIRTGNQILEIYMYACEIVTMHIYIYILYIFAYIVKLS